MVPSLWICLDELPKTETGKVRRTALENLLSHHATLSDSGWTPVEREIGKLFSEILCIGDVSLEDDVFDLGGDSLQAMRLIIELESAFGRRLAFEGSILDGTSASSLAQTITNAPSTVLRKGTTGRTLAISHALGVHLAYFLEAAHMFSPDFRVIGANASGMASNERFASTYKDLAADTISRLGEELDGERAPIFLGYGFGGPLALECARLFAQANQVAPPLVLIDPLIQWDGRWNELRASFNQARRGSLKTAASYLGRLYLVHVTVWMKPTCRRGDPTDRRGSSAHPL